MQSLNSLKVYSAASLTIAEGFLWQPGKARRKITCHNPFPKSDNYTLQSESRGHKELGGQRDQQSDNNNIPLWAAYPPDLSIFIGHSQVQSLPCLVCMSVRPFFQTWLI